MNILSFDTFGKTCTVAVQAGDKRIEKFSDNGLTHSVNLLPMIDSALKEAQMDIREIEYISVIGGPGSFTGIRIGVSTAKGLAHANNTPCILLNSLDVLSQIKTDENTLVCPILDARAGQVYTRAVLQTTHTKETIVRDTAIALIDLLEKIKNYNSIVFTGDAVPVHKNTILQILPYATFTEIYYPNAELLLDTTLKNLNNAVHYYDISPIYLRAPQAECLLKEKQSIGNT